MTSRTTRRQTRQSSVRAVPEPMVFTVSDDSDKENCPYLPKTKTTTKRVTRSQNVSVAKCSLPSTSRPKMLRGLEEEAPEVEDSDTEDEATANFQTKTGTVEIECPPVAKLVLRCEVTSDQELRQLRNGKIIREAKRDDVMLKAFNAFFTSTGPNQLLGRQAQCKEIRKFILTALKPNSSCHDRSMYISGVPGTGKTASVTQVITELQEQNKVKFSYVYVNALELVQPVNLFSEMYEQLHKRSLAAKTARQHLAQTFHTKSNARKPVLMVVDELDMLCNRSQDVLYDIFDWSSTPEARLIIISIANTLDLPERQLKNRISSRMGLTRVVFQPYSFEEITKILMHRLPKTSLAKQSSLELIGRKVAAVTGDLRKAFELTRRALEIAMDQGAQQLGVEHVMAAHRETQQSLLTKFVGSLSLHQVIFLREISKEFQDTGMDEIPYSSVYRGYRQHCLYQSVVPLEESVAIRILDSLRRMGFVDVKVNGIVVRWIKLRLAAEQIKELLVGARPNA